MVLGDLERDERFGRVQRAASRGIRLVPAEPDPDAFPFEPHACDVKPSLCSVCSIVVCPYGEGNMSTFPTGAF